MRSALLRRVENKLAAILAHARLDWWTARAPEAMWGLERLGSAYGGWVVPVGLLDANSVCYSAGVGLDVSFDLELIRRRGCSVDAFDPTPRSIAFASTIDEPRFHFHPVGLWDENRVMRFFAPAEREHVSHSILNLQGSANYFEAPCKTVQSAMRSLGHDRIDLLKMDIEGAEYRVLESMVQDDIHPGVLCVEFDERHHPLDAGFRRRIREQVARLVDEGYRLVHADGCGNYTFVHGPWLAERGPR